MRCWACCASDGDDHEQAKELAHAVRFGDPFWIEQTVTELIGPPGNGWTFADSERVRQQAAARS